MCASTYVCICESMYVWKKERDRKDYSKRFQIITWIKEKIKNNFKNLKIIQWFMII